MTHVTEQALEEAKQALRAEFVEQVEALKQELGVQITEAHNRTAGVTLEDVRREIAATPKPAPGLTTAEVEQLIADARPEPGLGRADVETIVVEMIPEPAPTPDPGITREEVQTMISGIPAYDDDPVKGRILRLRVFANELADRIGAPRMEG